MLLVLAHNTTGTLPNGTSIYDVKVNINECTIWSGKLNHKRDKGAAELLRYIADCMDKDQK